MRKIDREANFDVGVALAKIMHEHPDMADSIRTIMDPQVNEPAIVAGFIAADACYTTAETKLDTIWWAASRLQTWL